MGHRVGSCRRQTFGTDEMNHHLASERFSRRRGRSCLPEHSKNLPFIASAFGGSLCVCESTVPTSAARLRGINWAVSPAVKPLVCSTRGRKASLTNPDMSQSTLADSFRWAVLIYKRLYCYSLWRVLCRYSRLLGPRDYPIDNPFVAGFHGVQRLHSIWPADSCRPQYWGMLLTLL